MGVRASGGREAHRAATAFDIERVALQLFVDRGYDRVTAEQIAQAAGVSVRTFYRYFPEGKEGIVLMETRRGVEIFAEELTLRPDDEAAHVAVREAALASLRRVDAARDDGGAIDIAGARRLYAQVESSNASLLARLIGERVLLLEGLTGEVGRRMALDPARDPRPRLLLQSVNTAITVGWFTMQASADSGRSALTELALDTLESGFADSFTRPTNRSL